MTLIKNRHGVYIAMLFMFQPPRRAARENLTLRDAGTVRNGSTPNTDASPYTRREMTIYPSARRWAQSANGCHISEYLLSLFRFLCKYAFTVRACALVRVFRCIPAASISPVFYWYIFSYEPSATSPWSSCSRGLTTMTTAGDAHFV